MRTFQGALFPARPMGNLLKNRLRQQARDASIRRGIRALRELDDHLLRDIGLAPEDLPDAARYGRDFRLIRDLH